jgi:hypothetical protein
MNRRTRVHWHRDKVVELVGPDLETAADDLVDRATWPTHNRRVANDHLGVLGAAFPTPAARRVLPVVHIRRAETKHDPGRAYLYRDH